MKKNEYIILHADKIDWAIDENSSKYFKLKGFEYLTLINPLFYQSKNSGMDLPRMRVFYKIDNKYVLTTNGLVFKKKRDEINFDEFLIFLKSFINHIRYLSKQAKLNCNTYLNALSTINIVDLHKFTDIKESKNVSIRGDFYSTLVTWDMAIEADILTKKNVQIPIYIEIFIDALSGLVNHDFRKAILYSSIAMESMLGIVLDQKYEQLITKKSKKHRVTEVPTANGMIYKDPIYQRLKEGTQFGYFLHERPLYLLNRSILLEDEKLYNDAKRLYLTRNKIVHLGEPMDKSNQYITIDLNGAKEAFFIARKVFNWIGISAFDSVIIDKIINFE